MQAFGVRLAIQVTLVVVLLTKTAMSTDAETAAALKAGHLEWLKEVSVVCDFVVMFGEADSEEKAQSLPTERMSVYGKGLFVKDGETVRCRFQPEAPVEIQTTGDSGAETRQNVPHDEVSNGWANVRFEVPNRGTEFGFLAVAAKSDISGADRYQAGPQVNDVLTPLYIAGRKFAEPYSIVGDSSKGQAVTLRVVSEEPGSVIVECSLEAGGWTQRRRIQFWTEHELPVIREVEDLATNKQSSHWIKSKTEGQDFVQTSPGKATMIARSVRYIRSQKGEPWKAMLWRSENLGDRPPNHDDFAIQIPERCPIQGLPKSLDLGASRQLNILDLKESDLLKPRSVPAPSVTETEQLSKQRQSSYWILIVNGVILTAIVGWLIVRSRNRST
jgi:hypothetical protein